MNQIATLPAIAALARAGAAERGWELFIAQGYDQQDQSPAALTVKGRLFKGRARNAPARQRAALFMEAARAYGMAHAAAPAPYLAINAATALLLAGDPAGASAAARAVLALLDAPVPPADTPYFLLATRAEALLLLGETEAARAALADAARADPDGWSDRAATLAQLGEILAAQHADAAWLSAFAPPASLHFAGHMGLASAGAGEAALTAMLDRVLADLPTGFAWGALAAGVDVVIAEHLLARGIALHAVLSCPPDAFAAQSVIPAGEEWARRYHAVLGQAASLRWASDTPASVHDPLATALAGELAIGGALLNARALGTAAWQLIVTDPAGGGRNTAHQAALWRAEAGIQIRLTTPRDAEVEALFPPEAPDPARSLAVHLAIALDSLTQGAPASSGAIAAAMAPIGAALSALPAGRARAVAPGRWEALIADPQEALTLAQTMLSAARAAGLPPPSIGAHLAISTQLADPVSGALVPHGPGMALARRLCAMAPAGSALLSDALAVTLAARGQENAARLYHLGDDESEGPVHALSAPPLGQ